jgi:predicted aldo/keto reductase-like oxidoreductase
VAIPKVFAIYNNYKLSGNAEAFEKDYAALAPEEQAQECVSCMACVKKCPQSISIPAELKRITKERAQLNKKVQSAK